MVDGNYQPIFDFYGKDYADNTDDDADSVSDPGPMFTATNGPLDYYTYYPGYYDNDIAIHTVSNNHLLQLRCELTGVTGCHSARRWHSW